MRIVVAGATGYLGRALVRALLERGDRVVALVRNETSAQRMLGHDVEVRSWNPPQPGPWVADLNGADAVVNLAGEPISPTSPTQALTKRWTAAEKARIRSSRVDLTRALADAIVAASPRPKVFANQSAIGYYGDVGDTPLTESSPPGSDFLAHLVADWEAAARPVEEAGVRLVLLRTAVVLGPGGGALSMMALPFRFFAGGTVGEPGQWFSWIHLDDEVGLILYALDNDAMRGPINASSPNPVTMEVLSRQIGQALHRPTWVPFMGKALRLGLGEQGQSILASLRVLPEAAQALGYQFRYTDSAEAVRDSLR